MADAAVLLVAHGSSDGRSNSGARSLFAQWQARHVDLRGALCFLERGEPRLDSTLDRLAAGCDAVSVLPLFLLPGRHMLDDIPACIRAVRQRHAKVRIRLAPPLGEHPLLLRLLAERLEASAPQAETAVLLARGSRAEKATDLVRRLAVELGKEADRPCVAAFSDLVAPDLGGVLSGVAAKGMTNIAVLPLALFPGRMTEAAAATVAAFGGQHPHLEVCLAPALAPHPLLLQLLDERLAAMRR